MIEKIIYLNEIVELFNLNQITGDTDSLKRTITLAEINRPGFELAGFYEHSDPRRLIVMGDKEIAFIERLGDEQLAESFDFLTSDLTPAIIIAKGHNCPPLLEKIAYEKNFPILLTKRRTGTISIKVLSYLDEKLAEITTVHASFISIFNKGILIMGESGIGKSEISLDLIQRGHLLIADDSVELFRVRDDIIGRAPEVLKNMLEIRGVGIINTLHMFGVTSALDSGIVDYIIRLERWSDQKEYRRVDVKDHWETILGVQIPNITLPVSAGRNMSVVIEAAVMNQRLKETGYDSDVEFLDRIHQKIIKNAELQRHTSVVDVKEEDK